ncbi:MAG TPA: hypothetical protein VJN18_25115 [Polyangiaceae bacterium]|nr:hypothetical protein [Polyangiaceae bacterium]
MPPYDLDVADTGRDDMSHIRGSTDWYMARSRAANERARLLAGPPRALDDVLRQTDPHIVVAIRAYLAKHGGRHA